MPNPIHIAPYDPSWPAIFNVLSGEVGKILGSRVRGIHHVGSTAVPGLAAKPKIDLIAELSSHDFIDPSLSNIRTLGSFQFHGDPYGDGLWLFTQGHGSYGARLYVCGPDNPVMLRWLRFRECLRSDSALAHDYEALKRRLAVEAEGDWRRYTGGKSAFVEAALGAAEI